MFNLYAMAMQASASMGNGSAADASECKLGAVLIDTVVISEGTAVVSGDNAVVTDAGQQINGEVGHEADEAKNAKIDNAARAIGLMLVQSLRQAKLVRMLELASYGILNPSVYRMTTLQKPISVLFRREFRLSSRYLLPLISRLRLSHFGLSSRSFTHLRCLSCPTIYSVPRQSNRRK